MSDEIQSRIDEGETLSISQKKTPIIDLPLGATEDRICGSKKNCCYEL